MSIEISDMIEFVERVSKLELPTESADEGVKLCDLSGDDVHEFGEVFKSDIKVSKVRGV